MVLSLETCFIVYKYFPGANYRILQSLRAIVDGCETHITTANELARSLINKGKTPKEAIPPLKEKLIRINEGWARMNGIISDRYVVKVAFFSSFVTFDLAS